MSARPRRRPRLPLRGAPPYFLVTSLSTMLLVTGMNILAPVLPGYARTFGVTATEVGLIVAAFAGGRLLFDFVGGGLSDRFGVRSICLVGCAITGGASVVCAVTGSFGVLLAARVIQGIGSALYMGAATALVISVLPRGREGRWMSTFQGIFLLGLAIGPLIGGGVAELLGQRAPFLAYALMCMVALVLSATRLPSRAAGAAGADPEEPVTDRRRALDALVRNRAFVISLVIVLVMYAMRAGLRNTGVPLYAEEVLDMATGPVGLLLTASALGQVVVMGHAGRSVDRWGRRPVLVVSLFAATASVLVFPWASTPALLVGAMVLLGVVTAYSTAAPTVVMIDVTPAAIRGSAVGLQRTAIDLGQLVGPVLMGAAIDLGSYGGGFVAIGVLVLLAALASLRLPETRPDPARG